MSKKTEKAVKPEKEKLLLICIIYGKEFLERVLEAFLEIGIPGATVIQSQGMGRILGRDFPLFAGLRELLDAGGPHNYTVLSVVDDPKLVDEVSRQILRLKEGPFSRGILFTVPVTHSLKFDPSPNP